MFACHESNQCGLDDNRTSLLRKTDLFRSSTFISDLTHLLHGGIRRQDWSAQWVCFSGGGCVCARVGVCESLTLSWCLKWCKGMTMNQMNNNKNKSRVIRWIPLHGRSVLNVWLFRFLAHLIVSRTGALMRQALFTWMSQDSGSWILLSAVDVGSG